MTVFIESGTHGLPFTVYMQKMQEYSEKEICFMIIWKHMRSETAVVH